MMKNLKAIVAIVGIAFCLSACPKKPTNNTAADENAMNAAAPEAAAPEANAAAQNAAMGAKANPGNSDRNAERTDTGPRGNPGG
jgi:hypothetical protein